MNALKAILIFTTLYIMAVAVVQLAKGQVFPDPAVCPGAVNPSVDAQTFRFAGFKASQLRDVSENLADAVFARDKLLGLIPLDAVRRDYQIDHLIPNGCGGLSGMENLWAEPNRYCTNGVEMGGYQKDCADRAAGKLLKEGKADLDYVQNLFRTNWPEAYRQFVSTNFPDCEDDDGDR